MSCTYNIVVSGTAFSDFPNCKSIYFDGVDDFLQRTSVSSDDIGADTALTLNCWVKIFDSNQQWIGLIDYQASSTAGQRIRFVATESFGSETRDLYYDAGDGTSHHTNDTVWNFNQWHMFTVDVNNTEYKFYVDGQLVANEFADDAFDLSTGLTANLKIGVDGSQRITGCMRHISIHQGSLSANALATMYNGGTSIDLRKNQGDYTSSSALRHYWFLGDDDDLGPEGIRDRVGALHLTASGLPLIVRDTPHRS
jgi:hypothetical protein